MVQLIFPEKEYDRLQSLCDQWGISQDDIYYAVENDLLQACVWLPLRYIERGVIRDQRYIFEQFEHKEGFVGIRPEDFRRITNNGSAKLRIFRSVKMNGHILRLAYEPPQPALIVRIADLVVLKSDRKAFEKAYDIKGRTEPPKQVGAFVAAADYRHITLDGAAYQLGSIQASVIQQLHDAALSRNPWVHGKILLAGANSRAFSLRDVFKSQEEWRKLIASDGRGYYRLNLSDVKA